MTRTKTTKATNATIDDRVRQLVSQSIDPSECLAEKRRLEMERSSLQAQLDTEKARASDVDSLVDRIESGEQLTSRDAADRIKVLKDQCAAYDLAISRADRRWKESLGKLSEEIRPEFAAEHAARLETFCQTVEDLCDQIDALPQIPSVLASHGLTADCRHFPTFRWNALRQLRHQFSGILADNREFLNDGQLPIHHTNIHTIKDENQ